MSRPMTWLLAGAAALTLAAGAALAADPADAQRQAAEDSAGAGRMEARPERSERREVRVYRQDRGRDFVHMRGGRSEHLRTMLQLRPEQEGALKAYLEGVGQGAHHDHAVKFEHQDDSRTTTERLAEMEARMAQQQAAMRKRIDATKAFYAQLDARQRKVFDAMPMLMFAGPSFGPMLIPAGHPMPPAPPKPPAPPRL